MNQVEGDESVVSLPNKLLPNVVDACLGVFGVLWLQVWCAIEFDLPMSIVFPTEHFLLPLLQYSIGVETPFENILEDLEGIFWRDLDRRGHWPTGLENVDSRGGLSRE